MAGVADAGDHVPAPGVRLGDHPGDEAAHLVVLAQLGEPDDGVQPVGELVGLRAQRVGDGARGVEAVLQRGELGAVPQRDDGADGRPVDLHRHPVEHQHPGAVQHELVLARGAAGEHVPEPVVEAEVVDLLADLRTGQVEQLAGGRVEQCDPLAGVEPDHALLDAEQHRLAPLHQLHDLLRLQSEGLPADPAGEQQRSHDPHDQGEPEHRRDLTASRGQRLQQRRSRDPRGDDADDGAVVADHRHLCDDRAPVRVPHPRAALEGRGLADGERGAQLRGIGCGPDDRVPVHHQQAVGAGEVLGAAGEGGQQVHVALRQPGPYTRRRRDVLGHGQHPTALGLAERGIGLHRREDADRRQQDQHHQ